MPAGLHAFASPTPLGRTVIMGVAASDAHAVANQLIAHQLRLQGFTVVNLGVCTPLAEFAEAYAAHPGAEAILIGTLNGHAYQDLAELPALRAAGRIRCAVIVGGNVAVGGSRAEDIDLILDLGVDHVVADATELIPLLDTLHAARSPEFHHG